MEHVRGYHYVLDVLRGEQLQWERFLLEYFQGHQHEAPCLHLRSAFNRDLSHFDVGLVIDMKKMFKSAKVFNQDISAWATGNVSDMDNMFESAKAFNRDLSAWNVLGISSQPLGFSICGG